MSNDTSPAAESSSRRGGGYLPVLPDGWIYRVRIESTTRDSGIEVVPEADPDGEPTGRVLVHVRSEAGHKTLTRDSLGQAIRDGVAAAKVLDRLAKSEDEYRAARDAALASIGGEPDPEPVTPSTAPADNDDDVAPGQTEEATR